LGRFARFGQRVGGDRLGRPRWERDPHFELDLHLHRLALPAPGDRRALQELVAGLISAPLDRRRPLWDMHMIDGYGAGCALLVRVHHCVADGIALAQALGPLGGVDSEASFAPATADGAGLLGRLPLAGALAGGWRGAAGLLRAGVGGVLNPARLASAAGAAGDDAEALVRLLAGPPDARGPLKRAPGSGLRGRSRCRSPT
jgi:diacylglycerol O-acyltransferase / wax synthase